MNRLLFVFSSPPHGGVRAQEGLDALLMGSAFAECAALFIDEGVLQLISGQAPEAHGFKDFSRSFAALQDYGVTTVSCCLASMRTFGLSSEDLVIPVHALGREELRELLREYDKVLNF